MTAVLTVALAKTCSTQIHHLTTTADTDKALQRGRGVRPLERCTQAVAVAVVLRDTAPALVALAVAQQAHSRALPDQAQAIILAAVAVAVTMGRTRQTAEKAVPALF